MRPKPGRVALVLGFGLLNVVASCSSSTSTPGAGTASPWPTRALAPVPQPRQCQADQFRGSLSLAGGAAGHVDMKAVLANVTAAPCTVSGYPGVHLLDASEHAMQSVLGLGSSMGFKDPGPHPVEVTAGGVVSFGFEFDDVAVEGDPSPCPAASYLQVTLPTGSGATLIPTNMAPCSRGAVTATAFTAGIIRGGWDSG